MTSADPDDVQATPPPAAVVDDGLPRVVHDYPAAVLLVDGASRQVVFVNDLARQLAPDAELPLDVEDWSQAAGLRVESGGALGASSTPLTQVAAGDPETGRHITAALRSEATHAREALWAIGMPLGNAPEPLRARSLLILLPLRFPDAVAKVRAAAAQSTVHRSVLASGLAIAISDPRAQDDPLVWVSESFAQLTGWTSAEAVGRNCRFLQGPDTDRAAVQRLNAGLRNDETVIETLLNYRRDGSAFYNHLVVSPVFDADGVVTHRISVQTDVTQQTVARRERDEAVRAAEQAREAQLRAELAGQFERLLASLSEALSTTVTVADVATTISRVVQDGLGASGSGLLLPDNAHTHLQFVSMSDLPPGTDAAWHRVGWDEDVPIADVARRRRAVFFPDGDHLMAAHPRVQERAPWPPMGASAYLPLIVGRDFIGVLALMWDRPNALQPHLRSAVEALARYTAQAVQRATLVGERRSAAEVLQRSLLTKLPEPDHLELRARYVPAAVGEHVGGDWYDAVILPDGVTTVIIGDVTGHDMAAAAHMGQLRGLLRAFAFDRVEPPRELVSRLDRALAGLRVTGLATLVLARIEQSDEDEARGLRRLRWTNAGHPPPILLLPDGTTQVLDSEPELLIGLLPGTGRTDHEAAIPPGSTVLLYTDGLIEHRGRSLADGIEELRRVLTENPRDTLEELLDRLVVELVGDSPDDDCAILAVRAHPEDRPRPPEAGPGRTG